MGKAEGNIEDYLIQKAEEHGWLCMKFVSPGRRGVPDRILIGYGHTIFVELKSPTGALRKQQALVIKRMRHHGADVRIMNNKTKIDKFFQTFQKEAMCMARGNLYELRTDRNDLNTMDESDFYEGCGYIAEYFENADIESNVEYLLTTLQLSGIQTGEEYDEEENVRYPYFILTQEGKETYFKDRFEKAKVMLNQMTLSEFATNTYDLIHTIEDDYTDAVYCNGCFYDLDYFIRTADVDTKYYIGNVVLMG